MVRVNRENRSVFYTVKCECGNEQKIFQKASSEVKCEKCGAVLAVPTGGNAKINGEITAQFE